LATNYLEKAIEALQTTIQAMQKFNENMHPLDQPAPSYFMGPCGIYTLGALIYSHIDEDDG
jgi:hypothetical protein